MGDGRRQTTAKPPLVTAAAGDFVAPVTIAVTAVVAAAAAEGVGGEWEVGRALGLEGRVRGARLRFLFWSFLADYFFICFILLHLGVYIYYMRW